MDCGSCSEAIVEMVEKHSRHFYIRANRSVSLYDDIFALRGWKTERLWLEAVAKIVHGGKTRCSCFWPLWYETFTDTSYLTQTWRALDLNAQAESKLLYSSMFLSLQNGLGLQDSTYWTYTQAMMPTWWLSNLILGSLKSSCPFAYCLKSHHGVRGFCLLRLQHKDSLRKRVVLERYPQP